MNLRDRYCGRGLLALCLGFPFPGTAQMSPIENITSIPISIIESGIGDGMDLTESSLGGAADVGSLLMGESDALLSEELGNIQEMANGMEALSDAETLANQAMSAGSGAISGGLGLGAAALQAADGSFDSVAISPAVQGTGGTLVGNSSSGDGDGSGEGGGGGGGNGGFIFSDGGGGGSGGDEQ